MIPATLALKKIIVDINSDLYRIQKNSNQDRISSVVHSTLGSNSNHLEQLETGQSGFGNVTNCVVTDRGIDNVNDVRKHQTPSIDFLPLDIYEKIFEKIGLNTELVNYRLVNHQFNLSFILSQKRLQKKIINQVQKVIDAAIVQYKKLGDIVTELLAIEDLKNNEVKESGSIRLNEYLEKLTIFQREYPYATLSSLAQNLKQTLQGSKQKTINLSALKQNLNYCLSNFSKFSLEFQDFEKEISHIREDDYENSSKNISFQMCKFFIFWNSVEPFSTFPAFEVPHFFKILKNYLSPVSSLEMIFQCEVKNDILDAIYEPLFEALVTHPPYYINNFWNTSLNQKEAEEKLAHYILSVFRCFVSLPENSKNMLAQIIAKSSRNVFFIERDSFENYYNFVQSYFRYCSLEKTLAFLHSYFSKPKTNDQIFRVLEVLFDEVDHSVFVKILEYFKEHESFQCPLVLEIKKMFSFPCCLGLELQNLLAENLSIHPKAPVPLPALHLIVKILATKASLKGALFFIGQYSVLHDPKFFPSHFSLIKYLLNNSTVSLPLFFNLFNLISVRSEELLRSTLPLLLEKLNIPITNSEIIEFLLKKSKISGFAERNMKLNINKQKLINFVLACAVFTSEEFFYEQALQLIKEAFEESEKIVLIQDLYNKLIQRYDLSFIKNTPLVIMMGPYQSCYLSNEKFEDQIQHTLELYRLFDVRKTNQRFYKKLAKHLLSSPDISLEKFIKAWTIFHYHSDTIEKYYPLFFKTLFYHYVSHQIIKKTHPNPALFFQTLEKHLVVQRDPILPTLEACRIYYDQQFYLKISYNHQNSWPNDVFPLNKAWEYHKNTMHFGLFYQICKDLWPRQAIHDLLQHPNPDWAFITSDLNWTASVLNHAEIKHFQALEIKDFLLKRQYQNQIELIVGLQLILKCYKLFPVELIPEDLNSLVVGINEIIKLFEVFSPLELNALKNLPQEQILTVFNQFTEYNFLAKQLTQLLNREFFYLIQSNSKTLSSDLEIWLKFLEEIKKYGVLIKFEKFDLRDKLKALSTKIPDMDKISSKYFSTIRYFFDYSTKRKAEDTHEPFLKKRKIL